MTIYVDPLCRHRNGEWCHMMTDGGIDELHAMAQRVGLQRRWFQNKPRHPHYDLRASKRAAAVQAGAVEVSSVDMLRHCIKPHDYLRLWPIKEEMT